MLNKPTIAITIAVAVITIAILAREQHNNNIANNALDEVTLPGEEILETPSSEQPPVNSGEDAPPGSIHNLPVPQAVAAVRTKVAKEQGVAESAVVILEALEQDWSDGCLGLGGPAESCIQVITPGYHVVATAKGKEYAYRTNIDGSVIRAEK